MKLEISEIVAELCRHLNLSPEEIKEIRDNFSLYEVAIDGLLKVASIHASLKWELSRLSSEEARINYESYETFMAVHSNSVAISGNRGAIRLSGQSLSSDIESEIEELLAKYLLIKF